LFFALFDAPLGTAESAEALLSRGKKENSSSETPFLAANTTGETPVPQSCHGLLWS
jgi:hypothetical protein